MVMASPAPPTEVVSSHRSDVHTPATYARAIEEYAKLTHEQSLYPGQRFEALARFLNRSHARKPVSSVDIRQRRRRDSSGSAPSLLQAPSSLELPPSAPFATHYTLAPSGRAEAHHLTQPEQLENLARKLADEKKTGQLIFLRGYPSPAWLCTIGASYDVDPEFFRRHLNFLTVTGDNMDDQDGVSRLPSSSSNIFQFRLPTVASYTDHVRQRGAITVSGLRDVARASITDYLHKLRIGVGWNTGDSIVRQYNIHDMNLFSIEQAVTVYFSRLRSSPDHWAVIIFLDSGADPSVCEWPKGTSQAWYLPFPHQERSLALKPDMWKDEDECEPPEKSSSAWTSDPRNSPLHSRLMASRLHLRYGRLLRHEIMHQDPFYTLSELFSTLSHAESQVLDVIEHGLTQDTWQATQDDGLADGKRSLQAEHAQNNLVHARQMLEARISNLSSVANFIQGHQSEAHNNRSWPRCSDPREYRESDAAAKSLHLDFAHLCHRARVLTSRCDSAMNLAMNRASISEARRGMLQSQVMSRVTALAFFFVPASTTAGFFGMNFREFGTGEQSIWLFAAVAVPVFFISFMFLYNGWRRAWVAAATIYTTCLDGFHAKSLT